MAKLITKKDFYVQMRYRDLVEEAKKRNIDLIRPGGIIWKSDLVKILVEWDNEYMKQMAIQEKSDNSDDENPIPSKRIRL